MGTKRNHPVHLHYDPNANKFFVVCGKEEIEIGGVVKVGGVSTTIISAVVSNPQQTDLLKMITNNLVE